MRTPDGAFASSLDADSEGKEGRFYTWNRSEIESVLGPDAATFLSTYRLDRPADWHGDAILSLSQRIAVGATIFTDPCKASRAALLVARERRVRPHRAAKSLVAWNGLAISAVARAARQFSRHAWLEAAIAAFHFVNESTDQSGRL